MAEPDGVPQEAWIRLGAVQEIVRTPDSYDFTRYATHLRYLFKRIQAGESLNSANMQMYKNFREEFPQLAECVKHIGSYCRETWDATLSEEEELYLMIHLNRTISKKGL